MLTPSASYRTNTGPPESPGMVVQKAGSFGSGWVQLSVAGAGPVVRRNGRGAQRSTVDGHVVDGAGVGALGRRAPGRPGGGRGRVGGAELVERQQRGVDLLAGQVGDLGPVQVQGLRGAHG